jgi:hypothetical protein
VPAIDLRALRRAGISVSAAIAMSVPTTTPVSQCVGGVVCLVPWPMAWTRAMPAGIPRMPRDRVQAVWLMFIPNVKGAHELAARGKIVLDVAGG